MRIEIITWLDAGGSEDDNKWASEDELDDESPEITSVGWVVKETVKYVTLAMDVADDGQSHWRSKIPVGMIIKREVIKE